VQNPIEIPTDTIGDEILKWFQHLWESLAEPLIQSLISYLLNDPVGNVVGIVVVVSIVSVIGVWLSKDWIKEKLGVF
jgi:hypothetical protein